MADSVERQPRHDLERADAIGRKLGVGCFSAFIGAVSVAMVAVLLGKLHAVLTRAPTCEGIPLCNWHHWAAVGGLIGLLTLPVLVLSRLGRPASPPPNSDRG